MAEKEILATHGATTQVVEISVAAAEKRRLLLEVQGCG
jgi:hypothetical protein